MMLAILIGAVVCFIGLGLVALAAVICGARAGYTAEEEYERDEWV